MNIDWEYILFMIISIPVIIVVLWLMKMTALFAFGIGLNFTESKLYTRITRCLPGSLKFLLDICVAGLIAFVILMFLLVIIIALYEIITGDEL